jgi:hypothetical protein
MSTPKPPESGNHAWRTGLVLGTLLKHGVKAEYVYVPGSGLYSTTIKIEAEGEEFPELLIEVINNSDDDGHD